MNSERSSQINQKRQKENKTIEEKFIDNKSVNGEPGSNNVGS